LAVLMRLMARCGIAGRSASRVSAEAWAAGGLHFRPIDEYKFGDGMDWQIFGILMQDGITSGAIYALLALALVLVFSVTRVIFIPQGEFVAYGALTLAAIQSGVAPKVTWLMIGMGVLVFLLEVGSALRQRPQRRGLGRFAGICAGKYLVFPIAVHIAMQLLPLATLPAAVQVLLTICVVVPLGPMLYRIAYQRLSEATVLVLLIVSVSAHFMLTGIGLLVFGAEGMRTKPFNEFTMELASIRITGQSMTVVLVSLVLIVMLYLYFDRSLSGKALRATAVNRLGANLVAIGTNQAGRLAFTLAAGIGALSGILIGPMTTIFYDSGFLIGLKGFVAAIVGGLVSYPLAAAGAIFVGLLEAYSSFAASEFKEVFVFTLILPILLWRSLTGKHVDEDNH
jgi:branched-chain amino acid transport system permease protein